MVSKKKNKRKNKERNTARVDFFQASYFMTGDDKENSKYQ